MTSHACSRAASPSHQTPSPTLSHAQRSSHAYVEALYKTILQRERGARSECVAACVYGSVSLLCCMLHQKSTSKGARRRGARRGAAHHLNHRTHIRSRHCLLRHPVPFVAQDERRFLCPVDVLPCQGEGSMQSGQVNTHVRVPLLARCAMATCRPGGARGNVQLQLHQ